MYTVRKILSIVWKLGMYVEGFDSYLSAYIDGYIRKFFWFHTVSDDIKSRDLSLF